MVEKIKSYFNSLQDNENWFRFGTVFETRKKKYFLDTGTGKIFEIEPNVFKTLDCILRTNDFSRLTEIGLSNAELDDTLTMIQKTVISENILKAPPVISMRSHRQELKNTLEHALNSITLEITERCNLRCDYCIYGQPDSDYRAFGKNDMSVDVMEKAIDFLFERCGAEFNLGFYGGEPLLRFDLIKKAVQYSQEKNKLFNKIIHYSMTSNMTLMTEEIADYIGSVENFSVLASIDGPKEIHDEHRKSITGKGTFDDAIKGVKILVEARKRYGPEVPVLFSAVVNPPYTKERFDSIQNFIYSLDWLPENSLVQASYVSYGNQRSEYVPINERPENQLDFDTSSIKDLDPLESWTIFDSERGTYEGAFTYNYVSKPLNVIHKRKISDLPFPYYTMNGCCIPGGRKAFVTTKGDILPCERIGTIASIGNIYQGFDYDSIDKNYYDDYIHEAIKYCGECWAINICTKCYQGCMDMDGHVDFSFRHTDCSFARSQLKLDLSIYHELLENTPSSIMKLNEIDIM